MTDTPKENNYQGRWRFTVNDGNTYWRWDLGYSALAEYEDETADWDLGAMTRLFVPFGHTALAEADLDASGVPANAAYTYLAHDHLGTGRYGFNENKIQVSGHEHYPYGQRYDNLGPAPYHEFTGKPWDPDTKLYYFPYRYYSPGMNRWTTPDPAGLIDGPNVYGYVGGNPATLYDELGLWCVPVWTTRRLLSKTPSNTINYWYYLRGYTGAIWATIHRVRLWRYNYIRQTEWYCCKRHCGSRRCFFKTTYRRYTREKWRIEGTKYSGCIQFGNTWDVLCWNPWLNRYDNAGSHPPSS